MLEKNPSNTECLCNLGMALSQTQYKDYCIVAFEEAINSSPGNTSAVSNYLLFLLEVENFEKFRKVYAHACRFMDEQELANLEMVYMEFQLTIHAGNPKAIKPLQR